MAEGTDPPAPPRHRARWWVPGALVVLAVLLAAVGVHVVRTAETPEAGESGGAGEADPSRTVVVAVGDSNTLGVAAPATGRASSYPEHLQQLLGEEQHQVLNYGVDNRSLLEDAQFPYRDESAHRLSHDAQPDIVLIMLGTNDARDPAWDVAAYEEQLTAFVEEYQQLDSAPDVHLLTPPPVVGSAGRLDPAVISEQARPAVRDVAEATGAGLIDIHAALEDHPDLMGPDGVHPTAEGYELIAATVHEALTGDAATDAPEGADTDD
ncbi:GDSL-type esterase/lipase family protein [Brachybacterium sp. AOP43-C2-M15]|uniref:GDSL-type esterase/lipase family protein n=1 Tax=Brachybacterium sp. AOP43-C2-M15 TaxID=3457661 RepID=UPI00403391CB